MTDKQDEWLNPSIEKLQAGDWVQIDGVQNTCEVLENHANQRHVWIAFDKYHRYLIAVDYRYVTAAYRGDKPPVTDTERLDWLGESKHSISYDQGKCHVVDERCYIIGFADTLRQAIDNAMQQEGE